MRRICINCGDEAEPFGRRCKACFIAYRQQQRLARPRPTEPGPLAWVLCRFCGATGPTYPLRHGPGCPVKVR